MDTPTAIVTGDVMIDWNLSVDRDRIVAVRSWADAGKVRRVPQWGGAWLLEDLLRAFAAGVDCNIRGVERVDRGVHQTHTVVMPASDEVLRVHEFLGVERDDAAVSRQVLHDDPNATLVALLDSDLGFDKDRKAWPRAIADDGYEPWVILKTSVPAFGEKLWRRLMAKHADRLIVVVTADDLRRKEIQLIRRVSWERTAQDLVNEIEKSASLQALRRCRYLVVSFGPVGAMLLPRGESARLVFDPSFMEREWAPEKKPTGTMIGYTTILAAAVAHEVLIHPQWPQLTDALGRGVAGMRALLEEGFGKDKENPTMPFPAIVAAAKPGRKKIVSSAVVPKPDSNGRWWTILDDLLTRAAKSSPDNERDDALYELAARVAIYGPDRALSEVPQLRIGALVTVDREEIEAYRSIKTLLTEYVDRTPSKPLSIAVFGSPGSGKSFGVEEIAKSLTGKKKIRTLTFNLTQFARSDDLHGAFHQVRDVVLGGEIPLVFWDEFDTVYGEKELGWLRYFIGPMQDGQFQQDQITHPIGTSIFVFAGGTAFSKDKFVERATEADGKALKVPDFISRLKGFLNVVGPNPREGGKDTHYLIRRAILLRSMVKKHAEWLFRKDGVLRIAPGVLHGFLNTSQYVHGARSLESVITMSTLAGRKQFDSSSLPPEPQLALHVELPFLSPDYVPEFTHDVERLERQAELAHEAFRTIKLKQRWKQAEVRDDKKRRHNLLVPYAELRESDKEANRVTVRWIPTKIDRGGYAMVPAGSAEQRTMREDEVERLAELEHEIWMQRKLDDGYEWGEEATESPKRSPYLVEWSKLKPQSKEVDRAMIRAIPDILALAGYVLVKKKF